MKKQIIQFSDHFTYGRLIRFTMPSILMTIFTSIYGTVDGLFVSNLVGKTAFAALNLIYPYLMILGGVGAMLGVGGSALVAKTLGEGDIPRARRYFTMMMYLMAITGAASTVLGLLFLRPVALLFGATDRLIPDVMTYGAVSLLFNLAIQAQYTFQSYLIVAEKPKFALWVILGAGFSNIFLDWLFMAVLDLGIAGAALATGLSQCVGGLLPFLWFLSKGNTSALRFTRTRIEWKPMVRACGNGASEMMSSVSSAATGILYNWQLMRYAGEDGVAAYGVVMYAAFVFLGVFMGYSLGSSPVMGYHYGAANTREMKSLLKKSLTLLGSAGLVLTVLAVTFARPISAFFVSYDKNLLDMTARAVAVCAVPYLVMWFNLYTSSLFTALNDGLVSAAISFLRTLVLPVVCILVLPMFWQLDGVWYSLAVSEFLSLGVSLWFLVRKRKKYGYA